MYNEVFINELTELLERKFFLLPFKVLMADLIIELTSDRLTGEKKLISCIWGFYIHTKGFQKVRFEAYTPP